MRASTAGTPVLTITYRLGVSGRAFGLWSEDPGKRSDVLWVEPQAAVSASLGATRVEATLTPPPSVALRPELARELQVRGAEALYVPLTDSLWQSVIDFVGRAVGLTSTLPG